MPRIGDAQLDSALLLCPIAGYTDLAFRLAVRPLGGIGLASTELINPRGLARRTERSMRLAETDPADRPLCVQLYGNEPDELADAAQWAHERGAIVVDINMGCPVDKVCKTNAGSALMRDGGFAAALAKRVVDAVPIPVTVKMRLGWDDESINAPLLARRMEDVGVAAVTVHGRTALQRFSGRASLDGIARVVEAVERIPVIGNGDVRSPDDAVHMMRKTGCAGVMIGRAALGDPFIFRETHALITTGARIAPPTDRERLEVMRTHFRLMAAHRDEAFACRHFRQRVSWTIKKLGPCKAFHERMRFVSSAAEFDEIIERFEEWRGTRWRDNSATSAASV
jgi:nifR3 family TIM-barrel protein